MTTATATRLDAATIHARLATKDLGRASSWYSDMLGWQPVPGPRGALACQVGNSHFSLYRTAYAGTAKNTVMNWNVADLEAEMSRLRGRGLTFEEFDYGEIRTVNGILTDPTGGMTAWFKDADGNTIGILQAADGGPGHALSVMLAAADLARAKAWYADKLGFQPVTEFEGFVMDYRSGDTSFNIYRTEFAGTARNTVAIWSLKGIRDEVARLRARGVVFEDYDLGAEGRTVAGILSDDEGDLAAWFRDSEGNILALVEDRA